MMAWNTDVGFDHTPVGRNKKGSSIPPCIPMNNAEV
jgi:hypothetical protein